VRVVNAGGNGTISRNSSYFIGTSLLFYIANSISSFHDSYSFTFLLVLTCLDALRRKSNVLLLCTSNMVESVDAAFLDRIDLKICLGPPSLDAR
jgi:SpoVK/Ycf46/Vps4 family AAA+-type ATPase